MRAGHDRVRQPEPAGHGIVLDVGCGVARRSANVVGLTRRYANVLGLTRRYANVVGLTRRYANVAGFDPQARQRRRLRLQARQRRRLRLQARQSCRQPSVPVSLLSWKSASSIPPLWRARPGGYLKFTNDSGAPCRMSGWPAVTGLTATRHATRLRHIQSSMFAAWHYTSPPPAVTLQPGHSAYAIVAADDKPAEGNARCPAPYVRLRVSPPGDSGTVTISGWLPGAVSYLPACTSADGAPTAGTSTITTLSSLLA